MTRRFVRAALATALVIGLTSGCQAGTPDLGAAQAEAFQSRVLAVSTSVADGDYTTALQELTDLETELNAAAADGSVTFARHERIEAALVAVRADIQAAIDAATPAEETEPTTAPEDEPDEDEADEDEQDGSDPVTETEAEKKAREKAEKAAEEAQKKLEEAQKKAERDAQKKNERDAKKKKTEKPKGPGGP
ncbi:MAG: hypothetical protein ABWX65_12765 [Mycetocola sp.]